MGKTHLKRDRDAEDFVPHQVEYYFENGLRKIVPYTFVHETFAKERWLGRTLIDVCGWIRDRSAAYYEHAIKQGTITLNGKIVDGETVIQNSDLIRNIVHRHEPPVIGDPVKIHFRDEEKGILVVEKPGSMPVHVTGRYRFNTLLEVLKHDNDLPFVGTANRLDRLTSGIMVCTTTREAARSVAELFQTEGAVKKEYVCRAVGCFPEEEVICEEPLMSIDRQIGVNIVHPEGRTAKTIFTRMSYHAASNTSVIHSVIHSTGRPITGRTHQIRVHLQFLGYPIVNDPLYNNDIAWGKSKGMGGVRLDPDPEAEATALAHFSSITLNPKGLPTKENLETSAKIVLSSELKQAITELRKTKDVDDDQARYRDGPDQMTDGGNHCKTCGVPLLPDPKPNQLCIWLHATRYSSEKGGWDYESKELPNWAEADWNDWEDAMAQLERPQEKDGTI